RIEQGAAELRALQQEATRALQEARPAAPEGRGRREVIADFDTGLPDGWTTSGEAFVDAVTPAGRPVVSLGDRGVAAAGVADSGLHGKKLQGDLRSPTFTLEQPKLYVLMKSTGPVQVRVVVDGHFMHEFHTLLVKGTILKGKGADTKGKWEWKQFAADLVKYVGHEVYLEFSDLGDGSIAIDEISYERPGDYNQPRGFELGEAAANALAPFLARAAEIEKRVPAPVRALGTADGNAENERVHIRGSHANLGEEVPRRFLEALGGNAVPADEPGSGRLQLAARVADPENPLTARVFVNRLWHHLTGRGIVPTVDDFGVMGMEPSHPQLLDWMARDFTANGWSMKRAIRQIVTSRTYAMSCVPAADPAAVARHDADNVLLHKFRVRRLPAESIRDGVLATSGRLDRRMFGDSVPVHLTTFMEGRGRPKGGPLDGAGRRSIYIAIRRNFLPDFQMAFDMPSPFSTMGRRSVSNVPAQALVMMNDPFVIGQAGVWAKRLCGEIPESGARIRRAYLEAFSREPSEAEVGAAREFLAAQAKLHGCPPGDPKVWGDFCHVLFNQKEYIFLR
ncbi:MAG: DUF1553 domain-containing protein, partial [Akkermansiaceae bacterium]|nr:DUF1553 domain-containing protein [Akkermansiaceae bacterium]